ncbi:TIGR01244 family sulfur transferase [Pannonibacter phragmitetus]|uniref:TIGR01244 family sulfur transferase n=1 Tax=Pannonibacter phragmitetus TaxID=121719 RepID=UPI000B9646C6|nr:TIGR01244 family sulfur transferase [Pannonibacter phragmitetus]
MTPICITRKLSVAGQISAADIPEIRRLGFVAIVNNRPDGEEAGQPAQDEVGRAARAAGLGYVYLPVTDATLSAEAALGFGAALNAASGPVLAHCRSGARSFTLWAIGEVLSGRMSAGELTDLAGRAGCDPSGALNWLAASTAAHP